LPDEKRAEFIKAMEEPSSERTKQLLADNGLLHVQFMPWWKGGEDPLVKRPEMMSVSRGLVEGTPKEGPPLMYNICAVW